MLEEKLGNREKLLFLIEDINNNKFGYYFNGTVNNNNGSWMKSSGCFTFSLKSNRRLNGMKKFEEKKSCFGLDVRNKSADTLFGINYGFWIRKENNKVNSEIEEDNSCFDFHGLSNVFLSNSATTNYIKFTPRKIIVIQMN